MRLSIIQALLFISCVSVLDAQKISGNWIGILTNFKQDSSKAIPVLLNHQVILNFSNGSFRIEENGSVLQYEVSGEITNKKNFTFVSSKSPMIKPKGESSVPFSFQFSLNDSSGYVESIFKAPGSPFDGYHLFLEREIKTYELVSSPILSTGISKAMLSNIKQGIPAKEKRFRELQQFEFNPVYFEYNMHVLDSIYTPYLLRICRILKSHSDLRINIIGNTDGDGSEAFNLKLSKQRADEIKQFLIQHGIPTDRMIETYNGELNPVDSNDTESGKQKNRRVDFQFI